MQMIWMSLKKSFLENILEYAYPKKKMKSLNNLDFKICVGLDIQTWNKARKVD